VNVVPAEASATAAGYEACRAITRKHAKSFHFASYVLPAPRRAAAYAVYACCRQADDAVDEAPDLEAQKRELERVRERLNATFEGRPETQADRALADAAMRWGLQKQPFNELLLGMEIDLEPVRFRTWAELERYCQLVAGVVGHMLLPVLGASGEEARARAADLGVAMQLTNILRDVGEDLGRGRIYLPEEELAAFGLSHADVEARRTGPAWSAFMEAQVARARAYYERADRGVGLIETFGGRLCTRVMRVVYGDILRAIEARRYDTFGDRARVSFGRKLVLLGYALLGRLPGSARRPAVAFPDQGPIPLVTRGS
jgi:phytoene synthase